LREKMNEESPEPGKRHRGFIFLGIVVKQEFNLLQLIRAIFVPP